MSYILAIFALAILILVHELGHFIVAKLCGVYVERFSIGFGKVLISKKINDTEYCISAIPLGGYVKLHRMTADEEVEPTGDEALNAVMRREGQAFYNKPYYQKVLIIVAGVTFNMIFAVFLMGMIFFTGYEATSPVVGTIEEGGFAQQAGFEMGDRIVSINEIPTRSWEHFYLAAEELAANGATDAVVKVSRGDDDIALPLKFGYGSYINMLCDNITVLNFGMDAFLAPVIGAVNIGYPAETAGLVTDDIVLSINGMPVKKWMDIGELVQAQPEGVINIEISRNGEVMNLEVTPTESDGRRILGIMASSGDIVLKENIVTSMKLGFERTVDTTVLICKSIWKLIASKLPKFGEEGEVAENTCQISDDVGGPILIMQEASRAAKDGWERYLAFTALISVNLAILNILPVPILDGGHVVVYTIERLRRRPIPAVVRDTAQKVGFLLLMLLMVFAFYNDIVRFFK